MSFGKVLQLVDIARDRQEKVGFVDPAGLPGGGAPPMDPAAGGMPPMDPAAGGGGMPPMDPAAGGGGGGGAPPELEAMITSAVQNAMASSGGGMGGAGGEDVGIKPKIDVNVEIMQIGHGDASTESALAGAVVKQQDGFAGALPHPHRTPAYRGQRAGAHRRGAGGAGFDRR